MNINMRKKTVLALGSALMLLGTTLNAQEQPWSFGVKAGGSMSWLKGLEELTPAKVDNVDMDRKASGRIFITGGLTAGYAFHENVGVGIEVLYAGLGGELETSKKLPGDASDDDKKANKPTTLRMHSHNVVVPVMLKLFPMGCDPDEGILTVDLGAQFVMPLSITLEKKDGQDNAKFEAMKDEDDKEINKSKLANSFMIDAIAGISYEFPEIGLTLEGRYHFGFMDFLKSDAEANTYKKDKLGFDDGKNVSNHYATVSLGYNFARLLMD
jgi:Outer membrane protein beta-barrel domain